MRGIEELLVRSNGTKEGWFNGFVQMLWIDGKSIFLFLIMTGAGPVFAGAEEKLKEFQKEVRSLRSDFHQVVTDKNGSVLQDSKGDVVIVRPFRFRWNYRSPYEQVIVSDGKTIWFYDADLEQATIKTVSQDLDEGLALFLSANRPVEEQYQLETMPSKGGLEWVAAIPIKEQAEVKRIEVGFAGENPRSLVVTDNFGQVTRLEFLRFHRNPDISEENFYFEPPVGVDVLRSGN